MKQRKMCTFSEDEQCQSLATWEKIYYGAGKNGKKKRRGSSFGCTHHMEKDKEFFAHYNGGKNSNSKNEWVPLYPELMALT